MVELFEFWKAVTDHPRAQLGPTRRKKIAAAYAMGYQLEDLKLAVVGCKFSPHHQGQNDRNTVYDDIELIVRDEAHIDRFIKIGTQQLQRLMREQQTPSSSQHSVPMPPEVRAKLDTLFAQVRTR